MDEEGYLFFKSRSKDIIIRGGANIYPAEVEAYLRTHPNIIGAEAFGVNSVLFNKHFSLIIIFT
jgi:fatty-acyl-CoA synthase